MGGPKKKGKNGGGTREACGDVKLMESSGKRPMRGPKTKNNVGVWSQEKKAEKEGKK